MRRALLASLLVCSSAHAEFMDGNKLLYLFNSGTAASDAATFYVMGVHDTLAKVVICAPTNVTGEQVASMVKQYIVANPQIRHYSADSISTAVMSNAFPCKKQEKQTREF